MRPQGYNAGGNIRLIKKSSDLIGNRTLDLPASSIMTQATTLQSAPLKLMYRKKKRVCICEIWMNVTVKSRDKLMHVVEFIWLENDVTCTREHLRPAAATEATNGHTMASFPQWRCGSSNIKTVSWPEKGERSFVNRTRKVWNRLPAGVLASFPRELSTFRKRVREAVTRKGALSGDWREISEWCEVTLFKCNEENWVIVKFGDKRITCLFVTL
jgi:hypothetical protein